MKTVILLAVILSGCSYFDKKPTAQKFSDTDKCPDACKHIQELECEGWTTETKLQECIECCHRVHCANSSSDRLRPDVTPIAPD